MKVVFTRRIPTYLTGFLIGLIVVLGIRQVKQAVAPEFREIKDSRVELTLQVGGSVVIDLGKEPGHVIAWGFPTKLALGKVEGDRVIPITTLEYRDLVEERKAIGPIEQEGKYVLHAQYFVCKTPGEKFCAKLVLDQALNVEKKLEAPLEQKVLLDIRGAANSVVPPETAQ